MSSTTPIPRVAWSWAIEPALRRIAGRSSTDGGITYVMAGIGRSLRRPRRPGHGWRRRRASGMPVDPRLWLDGGPPSLLSGAVWRSRRRPSRGIRRRSCGACARASRSGAGAWTTPRPSRTWRASWPARRSTGSGSTWAPTRSWRRSARTWSAGGTCELPTIEFRGEDGVAHSVDRRRALGRLPRRGDRRRSRFRGSAPAVGRGGAAALRHDGGGRGRRGLRPPGPTRAAGAVAPGGRVEGPAGADVGGGDVVAGLVGGAFGERRIEGGSGSGAGAPGRRHSVAETPRPPDLLTLDGRRSTTPGERCGPRRASRRRYGRSGVAGAQEGHGVGGPISRHDRAEAAAHVEDLPHLGAARRRRGAAIRPKTGGTGSGASIA